MDVAVSRARRVAEPGADHARPGRAVGALRGPLDAAPRERREDRGPPSARNARTCAQLAEVGAAPAASARGRFAGGTAGDAPTAAIVGGERARPRRDARRLCETESNRASGLLVLLMISSTAPAPEHALSTHQASPRLPSPSKERGLTRPDRLNELGASFLVTDRETRLDADGTLSDARREASGGFNPPVGAFSCSRDFRPQLSDDSATAHAPRRKYRRPSWP